MSKDYVSMSLEEYKDFKKEYEKARDKDQVQFNFLGRPVLTKYAKYLIEFYDSKLKVA